ncbi:MAG: hypothetical protein VCB99_11640 [Myxococcota bacterium]
MPSEGATEPTLAYPDYLKHRDHLLGIVAIMTLMSGGTLLIVQIWEDATHEWPWRLVGTLGALTLSSLILIRINRIFGRLRGVYMPALHSAVDASIVACFVVVSLVIWGATTGDVAARTIGTVIVLLILSAVGVRIANMYTERDS